MSAWYDTKAPHKNTRTHAQCSVSRCVQALWHSRTHACMHTGRSLQLQYRLVASCARTVAGITARAPHAQAVDGFVSILMFFTAPVTSQNIRTLKGADGYVDQRSCELLPVSGTFPPPTQVNSRGGGKDSSVESGTREVAPGNICKVQEDLALVCDRCQQRDAGRTDLRGRQNDSGILSRRRKDGLYFFFKKVKGKRVS